MTLITSPESLTSDMVTIKRASSLTVKEATKGAQISALRAECKKGVLESSVVALLSQLKMFVKINVTDEWLFDWAEIILKDFWYFKFDELILALKEGATQKQYGEVLLSDVIGWLNDYDKRRVQHHENRNQNYKEGFDSNRSSETSIKQILKK